MKGLVKIGNRYNMLGKGCFLFSLLRYASLFINDAIKQKRNDVQKKETSDSIELQTYNMPKENCWFIRNTMVFALNL